ncbi:copper chaperone PCu(A)C [Halieaceae bacterium IMCC14734]|uniref:Copper chaperone PCu(A)C n=1 Tax=Candidatus Litorirhabdus singularis TaxID=2518993 RepID=A0ABT3TLX1_9GAMM|nr:copper chaperone PCu(A)C [Candidatus Litorirhabdus singularis]MCX2983337.1 copper chaperone PCu(A)C [Candidatus Litorirhabdus singularis]
MRQTNFWRGLALVFILLAAGVRAGEAITVSDAWMREMPPVVPNAALYMTLTNSGAQPRRVLALEADWARSLEFHESRQVDGMWQMQALDALDIGPGEEQLLAPGGVHIMVFGVHSMPRAGDRVSVRLLMDQGQTLEVEIEVRAGADASHAHQHH